MTPPTRRSRTRQAITPSSASDPDPIETKPLTEEKPALEQLLNNTYKEERFKFTFQEGELTAFECAQKMESFKTKEVFLATIPVEEIHSFLTKVLLGQPGRPLKCFSCDKFYLTSSGFWNHFKKCSIDTQHDAFTAAQEYKIMPYLWLKVDKKNQEEILKNIVGSDYTCFSPTCGKKFKSLNALMVHLDSCIVSAYLSFNNRPGEFRKLDNKTKQRFAREGIKETGSIKCLVSGCEQEYANANALVYHVDRCGLEKSAQPWKCYRCGLVATGAESDAHLVECAKIMGLQEETKVETSFSSHEDDLQPTSTSAKRRRTTFGQPRITARKDGSTLLRFRKSTVNREFNGIVTKADQRSYEEACTFAYQNWQAETDLLPFCDRLQKIEPKNWVPSVLENEQFHQIFNRKSVTIRTEKSEALQEKLPPGVRIESLNSETFDIVNPNTKSVSVAYCGAPVNGIKVAPGKTQEGEDVICVTTFANETDLESIISVVQFWRHKVENEKSELKLWFLLEVPGTILSMRWLQKHDTKNLGLIGFVAFSTTLGKVLIYRIDSNSPPCFVKSNDSVSTVKSNPHVVLSLPKSESSELSFLNATIKVEGEEVVMPMRIDESTVPILKIAWSGKNGGDTICGITALGSIAVWNINEDSGNPRLYIGSDWNSPPTDIAFLNSEHLVVGFREKIVKVINIDTWEVKLEESTVKTAGARVHTDPRVVESFFTFQSEYNSFPYSNATSISYIHMDVDSMNLILIPTGNTHQLMAWDVAMCAPLGTLLSCGVDGRLVASASGRFLKNIHHPFFANRSVMSIKRRRLFKEVQTMEDFLKQPKNEDDDPSTSSNDRITKAPLEDSLIEHDQVCKEMWIEIEFDKPFEPNRVELSCRDQRIESLNCVDATTNRDYPVAFTGGEAGLLFAVSSKLTLKKLKL